MQGGCLGGCCLIGVLLAADTSRGLAQAPPDPATRKAAATQVAPAPVPPRQQQAQARRSDGSVPTFLRVRNQMGKRFRLVEVQLIVDGVQLAATAAPVNQDLGEGIGPLAALLPPGNHVLTARLIYVGRNVGVFTYMDDIRFTAESTAPFNLEGPATLLVVANERKGANVPLEEKPQLTITLATEPAAAPGGQGARPGVQPARAVGQ